jgi:Domain of unknown function (DUF4123)
VNKNLEFRLLEKYRFGVIDPLNTSVLEEFEDLPRLSLAPVELDAQKNILPSLVDFSALTPARRLGVLEFLESKQIQKAASGLSALLASEKTADVVINHFRKQFIRKDAKHQRVLFRFHDPRVWHQLQWILDSQSIQQLMGPIDKWMYQLTPEWLVINKPSNAKTSEVKLHALEQKILIDRIGLINRVIQKIFKINQLVIINDGPKINQLLARGEARHRLTDTEDLVAYAVDGITLGEEFDTHPLVATTLKQLSDPEMTYQEVMRDIDVASLQRISKELNASTRRNT